MLAEIAAVVVRRHLVQREPAIERFALVRNQGNAELFDMRHDTVKSRVVEKDVLAVLIPDDHANVLPNFYGNGALCDCRVDRGIGALRPARLPESRHREGGRKMETLGILQLMPCR